ncbi:MAG: hypothetical protein ACYC4I_01860 [Minisyncoccota bacterium]
MTTLELKKIEKMAAESMMYARKSLQKSDEIEAYLSLLEYKAGKVNKHRSVDELFKKLKIA